MRRLLAGTITAGALFFAGASSAAAAPPAMPGKSCGNGPHGASHGTVHAHHTVPHANRQAHASIPKRCSYPA